MVWSGASGARHAVEAGGRGRPAPRWMTPA